MGMTVVVGYSATPEGRAALVKAADEALLRGAGLVVLDSTRHRDGVTDDTAFKADYAEVSERLEGAGVTVETRRLEDGREPADALIGLVEDNGAELLVIGLRRRSPVGKLILGSNAQRVLLDAPCPVLAVKAED